MATQLSRSFGEQGNQRTFTISVWVKRSKTGAVQTIMGSGGSGAYASHLYFMACLLYTSPSPRDRQKSRMPSSA